MKSIDRIFEIIFARFRRQLGEAHLDFAWRRASSAVSGLLVLPIAAAMLLLTIIVYGVTRAGTAAQRTHVGELFAAITVLLVFALLKVRLKKYLSHPPPLPEAESADDRRYVFWFHTSVVAIFVLVCLVVFVLHASGVRFIQGI
jgi:hypothetical protein